MILSKRVRAGVLLYAILMAAVFTLMLQSYLTHLNDFKKEYKAHLAYSKAHLLAEILRKKELKQEGQVDFNGGQSSYQRKEQVLEVSVAIGDHYQYQFQYPYPKEAQKEAQKEAKMPASDSQKDKNYK